MTQDDFTTLPTLPIGNNLVMHLDTLRQILLFLQGLTSMALKILNHRKL